MNSHVDWTLLAKYVANECSPAEMAEVERWASLNQENDKILREISTIYSCDPEASFAKLLEKVKKL